MGDVSCELSEWQCIQLPLAWRWLVEKVSLALSFQGEEEGSGKGGISGEGEDYGKREGTQTSTSLKPGRKAKQANPATYSLPTTWEG